MIPIKLTVIIRDESHLHVTNTFTFRSVCIELTEEQYEQIRDKSGKGHEKIDVCFFETKEID